jgi:hypothetical protein
MDKATAEKMVNDLKAACLLFDPGSTRHFAKIDNLVGQIIETLTHPPVSQPLPTAKPQGEARECWVVFGVPGIPKAVRTEAETKEIPWVKWTHMREVHPIEGKGSAPECSHQNARQFNYTDDRICDDCHKIISPKIRPFLPDPPCQYCNKNMVYGDHHPYCGTCGRWEPISSRVPPDAPANHIPDTNKMVPLDAPRGENCFGVDAEYFHRELTSLAASLMNRPAKELAQYLRTLANAADPEKAREV